MSGSIFPNFVSSVESNPSKDTIKLLTCESTDPARVLKCLQNKSMEELLKAFESIYRNDKRVNRFFGPVNDQYLRLNDRVVLAEPFKLIVEHNYTIDVPLL